MAYEYIKRFIWEVDDDDLGLTMRPTPHSVVVKKVDPMRFQTFKVIPIFEKKREDRRKKYRVYVGYGDGEGKFGFGVFCGKNELAATEKAKNAAARSVLVVPRSKTSETIDKKRLGRHGATIVTLIPSENAGLVGTEKLPMVKQLLLLAGIKHCLFSCNEPHLGGNMCLAIFDAFKN